MLAAGDSWRLSVRGGGGHDLLTLSPLLESPSSGVGGGVEGGGAEEGVAVAPIGLTNLMNSGGAVLGAELAGGWVGGRLPKQEYCWLGWMSWLAHRVNGHLGSEAGRCKRPAAHACQIPIPPFSLIKTPQRAARMEATAPSCACACAALAASCCTPRAAPLLCCWTGGRRRG